MTDPLRARLSRPGSVVVVGHTGRMGSMLMREGLAAGVGMAGIDKPLADLTPLASAAVVVLCVPARLFEDILHLVCPAMAPDAVLCDITSVKVAPIVQMLNVWPGDVVGTHPLFGPSHGRDEELSVAMVKSRRCSEESFRLAEAFFSALGYSPFETDAETHDKAMARIQNMNFITSLAYFAQTADDRSLERFITPSFRRRLAAAHKLLTEDGPMFAGLFETNPFSQAAVRQFSKLLSLASAGDIDLLLSKARRWWPEERVKGGH